MNAPRLTLVEIAAWCAAKKNLVDAQPPRCHLAPNPIPIGGGLVPQKLAAAWVYGGGRESYPVTGTVAELEQYPIIGRYANAEGDEKK